MKNYRIFYAFCCALLMLLPFKTIAQEDNRVGFVAADAPINVRNRPNGSVIASLPPNMSVAIVDQNADGTWLSVEMPDGSTGWVSASLLRVMESAVPADLVPIMPDNAACLEPITALASILSTGFAFSPDGRLLASYSWQHDIEIYDVRTKILITKITKHTDIVSSVAFSPDGSEMASSSWDGSVKIWNTQTWGERTEFMGHTDGVNDLAYSPDGELLASVGQDGVMNIWNVQTGERVQTIELHSERVNNVAFSPDGTLIATAGDYAGSVLHMWNVATGEQVWQKTGGGNLHIAFSPDGTSIVQASGGTLTVTGFDVQTGKQTFVIMDTSSDSASGVAVNPSSTLVAAGTWHGAFMIADVENKTVLFTDSSQERKPSGSIGLAFSPDGRLLVTTDGDHTIMLWGVHSGGCTPST